ncbi:ABC transporter ATP-binding protein [Blautia coccoides]|uniref:ABC transporter ATP-binding protein n=1 Tax=Blautia producta TaxID=33035 RepID=UPI0028A4B6FC|nr:ABC transporter ATP-binding protein [Blautia coccoides]MDT4372273.1 ABC transporter ATP-binding protein [Blautia coccoides]
MKTPLLSVKNLDIWYDNKKMVLSHFDIELDSHEVVGLIGLNGAGKTTFLKTLSGLIPTFRADSIRFLGHPAKLRNKDFKTCRYTVFSEDNSFQYFTFQEYLTYVFAAYGKTLPDVSKLVHGFHFEEFTNVLLKDLSAGSRKKVFLITAFALKPELLLLDEPVNGLDFQSTEYLYRQMACYKEYGTVLFSSHILESITLTSDKVLVLEDGAVRNIFKGGEINAADIREALRYEYDV